MLSLHLLCFALLPFVSFLSAFVIVTVPYPHSYAQNPFQIGCADRIFAFSSKFSYGQRSKCADLLNSYYLSTIALNPCPVKEYTRDYVTGSPSIWQIFSLSLCLSMVRSCSKRITESFTMSQSLAESSTWVGSFALFILDVIAAQITVGLCLFPTSFWITSTGRTPPCSEPTTGLRSA